MKIAFVANPNSQHDAKWINEIAKLHEVLVISNNKELIHNYLDSNIEIHPLLPAYFSLKKVFKNYRTRLNIESFLLDHNIDIVHTMYTYPNLLWIPFVKGIRYISTTRGSDILIDAMNIQKGKAKDQLTFAFFSKKLFDQNCFTCTSTAQRDGLLKLGISKDKVTVIPTGIDTEKISQISTRYTEDKGSRIFSPRINRPIYQLETIIDAFSKVQSDIPDSILTLVFDEYETEYTNQLQDQIKALGLRQKVEILPKLNHEQMVEQYKRAQLIIMNPKSDGTPNSALEALVLNKKVLMPPKGLDETLFNENTVFFLDETKETIAESITRVLKEKPKSPTHDMVEEKASLSGALAKLQSLYNFMVKK